MATPSRTIPPRCNKPITKTSLLKDRNSWSTCFSSWSDSSDDCVKYYSLYSNNHNSAWCEYKFRVHSKRDDITTSCFQTHVLLVLTKRPVASD